MAVARALVAVEHTDPKTGEFTLRRWRGAWWKWERSRWAEREDRHVTADAYGFTEHATFIDDKGTSMVWAPNRYKIADLLDALAAITHLGETVHAPEWTSTTTMPPAAELVAVKNGLLHITTRELYPHDPRLFNLVSVPFAYDPDARAPGKWLEFLHELWAEDPDAIAALAQFFGYVAPATRPSTRSCSSSGRAAAVRAPSPEC
jgi:putative DNA primase/helicase